MQQPDAHTMDYVVAIIAIGALAIGLVSMLVGRLIAWWDQLRSVSHSQDVLSSVPPTPAQTTQTDEPDRPPSAGLSAHDRLWREFLLDRTRERLIAVMVDSELGVGEIRGLLKGDSTAISAEAEAARRRLGIMSDPRLLKVRDEKGEREIAMV